LLAGPAAAAGQLLLGPVPAGAASDTSFALLHGLYWLAVNLAADKPVLVAVDDAHWADDASMRWLAHLTSRLEGSGVAVLATTRPAERSGTRDGLARLRAVADTLRPGLLDEAAVTTISRRELGADADAATCAALWRESGGNPFYLHELLRTRREGDPFGGPLTSGGPGEGVTRRILARIRRLAPEAVSLAQALAVLGEDCHLRHGAAMSGLGVASASRLAQALIEVEVLAAADPPRFLHPVIRAAVESSIDQDQLHRLHRAAATQLADDQAPEGRIGAHLMRTHPSDDPWVVTRLRAAAGQAMGSGAPAEAGALLRRALAEPPGEPDRIPVLRELAAADAHAGRDDAVAWLDQAMRLTSDTRRRAELAHDVARTYASMFRWVEAVDVTDQALHELGDEDPELAGRLESELVVAAMHDARRAARVAPSLARLGSTGAMTTAAESLLAASAMSRTLTGQLEPAGARRVAEALSSLEPAAPNWDTRAALLWTLITAEQFDAVATALPAMIDAAGRSGSARGLIAVYSSLGYLKFRLGALPEADAALRVAVEVLRDGDFDAGLGIAAVLADVTIESGDLDAAHTLLDGIPSAPAGVLSVLVPAATGRLHLARGEPGRALEAFAHCAEMFSAEVWGAQIRDVGYLHARSGAALALLQLGDLERARELAGSELADVRAAGGPRALGIALRTAGLTSGGQEGLSALEESVSVLNRSPALLERARSLVELGAALRRRGRRSAARPMLTEALDLAISCGAEPLAERARTEIRSSGGRPRRERLHGVEALTPSELRVARLAADGLTNRQIAHSLYVTLKTVETHLARAYTKLGITERARLAHSLNPAQTG
jgi:DNA-binding CsgD family transcriptional regulator